MGHTDQASCHVRSAIFHNQIKKLLKFLLVLKIFRKLIFFLISEGNEVGFQKIEGGLVGFLVLTFKKTHRCWLYIFEDGLWLDRFYVILILFLKNSLMLLHKPFLETDFILWGEFFLGKGLEFDLGKFLGADRRRIFCLFYVVIGTF